MVSALRPLRLVAAFLAFIVLFTTTGTAQTSKYSDRAWAAFTKLAPDRTATGQTAPQWIPSRPLAGETLPPANNPDSRIRPTTNTTQSEMSMAVSPIDNRVILGSANCSDFPVSVIYGTGAYWSTDGGLTWAGFDNPPSGNGNQGDPASVIDRNGTFFVGSIAPNDGQGVMRSFDGGATWTYHQVSNPNGDLLDKNHMTVDNSPASPYEGNLYAAWTDFGQSSPYPVEGARSTDHGQTWVNELNYSGSVMTSSEFGQGVNLATGPNGEVYAAWAINMGASPYTEQAVGFNRSTDGGVTWGPGSRAVANIAGIRTSSFGTYGIRANSFPSMAVSMTTGNIYIVWTNKGVPGINTGDPDIYMIKSTDGGSTFGTPVRVNTDPIGNNANQWFPWISVDPETDMISMVFMDGRNHIGTALADVVIAQSLDGGATFEDFVVNDASFSVGPLPGFGGNYAGDYIGYASRGGRGYPIWNSQVPSTNSQGWVSPVLFYPPNAGFVKGTVTGSGNPLNGVRMDFVDSVLQVQGTTDPAGNFKISAGIDTPFTTGQFTLRAQKFGFLTFTDTVTLVAGDTVTRNVTMTPAPGGTLAVHAYRSDSSGVRSNVKVVFAGLTVIDDYTDSTTGMFTAPLPVGSYTVTVDPPSPYGTRVFTPVDIQDSQTTTVDALVRFVLEPSPTAVRDTLVVGQISGKTLTLTNTTTGPVQYRITDDNALRMAGRIRPQSKPVKVYEGYELPKGASDPHEGIGGVEGRGGPDAFGYQWVDSDEPDGPVFNWVDISGVGTPITTWTGSDDDGHAIAPLPWSFPLYGTGYDQVKIATNGFISFDVVSTNHSFSNGAIPATAEPNLSAYAWWDDLDLGDGGSVHYYDDAANGRFIVQYTNVPHYSTGGPYTFQVILYPNGNMMFQYLDMQQVLNSATIGIENGTGTDGLQVVFNNTYVHNNLAISFRLPDATWISENPVVGTIPAGGSQPVAVTFDATGLTVGSLYNANLFVDTDNPDVTAPIAVPASLNVELADSAVLILSSGSLTFPAQQINTTVNDTITIRNGGLQTLNVSSITSTSGRFVVSPASATLSPNDSAWVVVAYTPTTVGTDTGRIVFLSNSQGSPRIDAILSGTAIGAPAISLNPTSLADTLQVGDNSTLSFTITNTTPLPTTPLYVTLSDTAAWLTVTPVADTLTGGASGSFSVALNASGLPLGMISADITFASNDPATPTTTLTCNLLVVGGPVIVISPDTLAKTLVTGGVATDTLVIRNAGVSPLNWTLTETPTAPPQRTPLPAPAAIELPKDMKDPGSGGPVTEGQGGPDGYGYRWIDSDEPGGPTFNWVDISGIGTPITTWTGGGDDGRATVPLPFSFPFYGTGYTQLKVTTNGWISFDVVSTNNTFFNAAIPAAAEPNLSVYPWWDDLNVSTSGTVHYYNDAANNRFIVQYTNVPHYASEPGLYTFQVILNASGSMLCQYLNMQQTLTSATIGIENAGGSDGLQVVYNANYIHNNMAILFSRGISWLAEDPTTGSVNPGDSAKVGVTFNTTGLLAGVYNGVLQFVSNDFGNTPKNVPVRLQVTSPQLARLQVIHNAADPAADTVDIYLGATRLVNDFVFRRATPFINAPAGSPIVVGVAPGNSTSVNDTITSFTLTLTPGQTYVAIANGVLTPGSFAPNPDGRSTGFRLFIKTAAREVGSGGNVEFAALHGSTDAPTVDIVARGVGTLVNNAAYGDITAYIAVPPAPYTLDVKDSSGTSTVASFGADLSGLANGAAVVFASGFLNPGANQNGPAFGLYAALASGAVVRFTPVTSVTEEATTPSVFSLSQNYPNPFNPSTVVRFGLPEQSEVSLKVFDILGREVATLASGVRGAGWFITEWNGRNDAGLALSSGVYFYRLEARGASGTAFNSLRKMILMK